MIADLPIQQATGRHLAVDLGDETVLVTLDRPVVRLGRGLAADVPLEDPTVSRRHALIVRRGDDVVLLDDRSRNGTWLNDRRVSEATLADGDVIAVGRVRMRFVDPA